METKRILLVEDNAVIAYVIQESLAELQHHVEVRVVGSGEDASSEADKAGWDVIITDHLLPGMTGLELIRSKIDRLPGTKWILITAFGSNELEREVRRLKIYRYMTKPFPLEDLREVVQEALAPKPVGGDAPVNFYIRRGGLPPS